MARRQLDGRACDGAGKLGLRLVAGAAAPDLFLHAHEKALERRMLQHDWFCEAVNYVPVLIVLVPVPLAEDQTQFSPAALALDCRLDLVQKVDEGGRVVDALGGGTYARTIRQASSHRDVDFDEPNLACQGQSGLGGCGRRGARGSLSLLVAENRQLGAAVEGRPASREALLAQVNYPLGAQVALSRPLVSLLPRRVRHLHHDPLVSSRLNLWVLI